MQLRVYNFTSITLYKNETCLHILCFILKLYVCDTYNRYSLSVKFLTAFFGQKYHQLDETSLNMCHLSDCIKF